MTDHLGEDVQHWGETALAAIASTINPALGAVVGGVVGYNAVRRGREMGEAAFKLVDPDALVARLGEDERLADLFTRSLDAATRTALASKRRAMGRAVGEACIDSAVLDHHELLVWALDQLEAIHFRLLAGAAQVDSGSGDLMELAATYPSPVNATLIRVGAASSAARTTYDGVHPLAGPRTVPVTITDLTEFGLELLEWVATGDGAEPGGG